MNNGRVLIVSGPSGSGKDTILKRVFDAMPEIRFSISTITRPRREGDAGEEKYRFVTVEQFQEMIDRDDLLEYNEYLGNYYGTPRSPVENAVNSGSEIIIEVDVNGAANIRKRLPEAVSVFIMPPSFEVLKARLSGRGTDKPEVVEKRLNAALAEIARADEYDYIVVNDDLDTAVEDFLGIVKSERLRIDRQKHLINEVLQQC